MRIRKMKDNRRIDDKDEKAILERRKKSEGEKDKMKGRRR